MIPIIKMARANRERTVSSVVKSLSYADSQEEISSSVRIFKAGKRPERFSPQNGKDLLSLITEVISSSGFCCIEC